MKKNNKGFTLTELLAIIVLLAIITVLAAPSMTKLIKREEDETQNILNTKIENAAKLYAAKYYANDIIKGNQISFTLDDLEKDGLLRLKDNECNGFTNENILINPSGEYDYSYIDKDNCYKDTDDE